MAKNLIYILSDQHRADAWSRYNPEISTPSLERLAAEGASFSNCCCQSQPCVPARASILTGQYSEVHGLWNNQVVLPDCLPTWPRHLSRHGFQTVAVGRTHHIDNGFDNLVRVPSGSSYPHNNHEYDLQVHFDEETFIGSSQAADEDYYESKITETAIDFLKEMSRSDMPFALYVGYLAPHTPYTPPEPYWSMYADKSFHKNGQELPPEFQQQRELIKKMMSVSDEHHERIVRGYYAMVSLLDNCIGRLLDAVDDLNLSEETLVIYTSDHGEQLGHRQLYSKCFGYDAALKVPLFIRQPGTIKGGTEIDAVTEHVDLLPTIFDALEVPPMPTVGSSVWDACCGSSLPHRDIAYCSFGLAQVLRSKEWKWIHSISENDGNDTFDEVYDLVNDPDEQHNIVDTDRGREIIAKASLYLQKLSMTHFRTRVQDNHPEAVQPPLIPFFTT